MFINNKCLPKISDSSSGTKMSFVQFHSVNVKENLAHLAEKNS